MGLISTPIREGVTGARKKVAVGKYDFAVDGGVQGTIALMGVTSLLSGSVVTGGFVRVTTQLTSLGSATIAVQVNAANDILTAVAVASWTTGIKNILPAPTTGALTASTRVLLTADRDISIVIATADLTAGVFYVVLEYTDALV